MRPHMIGLVVFFATSSCVHGDPSTPWEYSKSKKFVTAPGEPKIEVDETCRDGQFWFGQRRECFTKTCSDGGNCEISGDEAIMKEKEAVEQRQKDETNRLLAAHGKSCHEALWNDCVALIESLFRIKSYTEAQALKTEACSNPQIECRFVDKKTVSTLTLKKGQKVLWQRDLKSTWSPELFFKSGYFGKDTEYVDLMILNH